MRRIRTIASLALQTAALLASSAALADGYTGDLGLGIYTRQGLYHGESAQTDVLPYVYGQWGRVFGRVDTFGYQLMPLSHGFLEISTRILQDQMKSDSLKAAGVRERKNSRLLGVSTFQITPMGAFSISLMQDVGKSKGQVFDASWIGALKPAPWLSIYPEFGIEVLSKKYGNYYYGVDQGEGGFSAYEAGWTKNPYVALHTSSPLGAGWNLAFTLRDKPLATAISDSPIVAKMSRWNAYVAVSYEFK